MSGPGDEFICEQCHGVFTRTWTDDEADAEARDNGFDPDNDDMVIVCDDCYQKMTMLIPPKLYTGIERQS